LTEFTLWAPDPLPEDATDLVCFYCDEPAVGLIHRLPICRTHTPAPCEKCGVLVLQGQWPLCGRLGASGHGWTRTDPAQRFDPVLVFRDPKTGEYRFPGRNDAPTPKGYVREELRTISDVRQFERRWNQIERGRADAAVSREQARRQAVQEQLRPDLYRAMQSMPAIMRDFARAAIERGNARPSTKDPGCHVSAFSDDRSTRANESVVGGLQRRRQ